MAWQHASILESNLRLRAVHDAGLYRRNHIGAEEVSASQLVCYVPPAPPMQSAAPDRRLTRRRHDGK